MIIVTSLKDHAHVCESVQASHLISVIDPGFEPTTPKFIEKHLKLGFDDIIEIKKENFIYRNSISTQSSFLNNQIQIDLNSFLVSLFCAAILSLFVQLFYVNFSSTLSNRIHFSKNFVILGVTTCIIIMIVKNSLALSLGLVGALSIVRFRAAIKEPEELVYLFLVITTGLGCGSGQLKITIVGIAFSLLIIFIYYKLLSTKKIEYAELINLAVVFNQNINQNDITKIIEDLKKVSTELNFVSMSKTSNTTNLNLDIRPKKFEELIKITDLIKKKYKNAKIIVARSNNLNL